MKTLRQAYPNDLLDEEWQRIAHEVSAPQVGGRVAEIDRREIVNAILYVSRSGVPWRMLPHDFPNWSTVYYYYWVWYKSGVWQHLLEVLTILERVEQGRQPQPSAAVIDWKASILPDHKLNRIE